MTVFERKSLPPRKKGSLFRSLYPTPLFLFSVTKGISVTFRKRDKNNKGLEVTVRYFVRHFSVTFSEFPSPSQDFRHLSSPNHHGK